MSASLVGSEMCIRDSGNSLSTTPNLLRACRCFMGRSSHALARPSGQSSVSYTHLTLPTICSV
eukprot:7159677-Alexandrium_andersonii.AAC.1